MFVLFEWPLTTYLQFLPVVGWREDAFGNFHGSWPQPPDRAAVNKEKSGKRVCWGLAPPGKSAPRGRAVSGGAPRAGGFSLALEARRKQRAAAA